MNCYNRTFERNSDFVTSFNGSSSPRSIATHTANPLAIIDYRSTVMKRMLILVVKSI